MYDLLQDVSALRRSVGFRVPDSRPDLCGGDRFGRLGAPVHRAAPGRAPPLQGAARAAPHRPVHPGRRAVPHPRPPGRPLLRAGRPADGPAAERRDRRRRGARLQVLRRARPDGLRRRHREPGGQRRAHRGGGRRRGPAVPGRQPRRRAEVPARPLHLERAAGRGAGAGDRPYQAGGHRAARRREARRLARRAQHHHRAGRDGAADQAAQHALRHARRERLRHLLHRLLRRHRRHRADAAEHVPGHRRGPARPHPRLLDRRHRLPVLRARRRLPGRPAARARGVRRRGPGPGAGRGGRARPRDGARPRAGRHLTADRQPQPRRTS